MSRLVAFALGCFVIGIIVMVGLELTWLGIPLLFAFIVAGVFAIADPAFLRGEDD
jgi:hypothetical protein